MTEDEDGSEELEMGRPPRREEIGKGHVRLEVYGKHADSIEDELRAWSDLLSKSEREHEKRGGSFRGWGESIKSWFKSRKKESG